MRVLNFILLFVLVFTNLVFAAKIGDDELKVGKPGSSANKVLKLGDTRLIRSNETSGNLEFSNDNGALWKKVGSGSGSGGAGGVNILSNASFEDGLTNWTNSGGTLTQETYTNGLEGNTKYARFVATASGQYVETDLTTFADNLTGGGMADFKYLQGDSAFVYKVIDGSAAVISSGDISDLISWLKAPTVVFDIPSQAKLRIEATAAGTIDFDEAYLGSNKGFIDSQSLSKTTSYSPTYQGFGTPTEEDVTYMHIGDKLHIEGRIRIGTNSAVEAQLSLPDGYTVSIIDSNTRVAGSWFSHQTTSAHGGSVLITNGDTFINFSHVGVFGSSTVDASNPVIATGMVPSTAAFSFYAVIPVGQSKIDFQEAFTPDQADFFVQARVSSASAHAITTGGALEEQDQPSLTLTQLHGASSIACIDGVESSGTDCGASNESFGLSFNAPVAGKYEVCSRIPTTLGISATLYQSLKLVDNTSGAVLATGEREGYDYLNGVAGTRTISHCGIFDISSVGKNTFKLHARATVTSYYDANLTTFINTGAIFTARLLSHNVSRPIVQNMVDTSRGAGLRTEGCTINNNGTATIDTGSGLCESWIDSVSRVSLGQIDLTTKTGVFSKDMICTCTARSTTVFCSSNGVYPTSNTASFLTVGHTGSLGDIDIFVSCKGAR